MELHYRENKKRQDIPRGATAYAKAAGVRNMRPSGGTGPDQEYLWAGPTLGQEPTKEIQEEAA